MPEQAPQPELPQFKTAQYAAPAGGNHCGLCGQPLGATYYWARGNVACAACALKARAEEPLDKHSAFARSLLFGVGAATLGLILYSAFTIITRIEIGFMSLAVGYLVGKGMKLGSNGAGGRRYQIAAAILTYLAVSLSVIPVVWARSGHLHDPRALLSVMGRLLLEAIASPFLDLENPLNGALGLFILFVGIRFAWQLTTGSEGRVAGPFANRPRPSASAS
jgi:hypothetical protein